MDSPQTVRTILPDNVGASRGSLRKPSVDLCRCPTSLQAQNGIGLRISLGLGAAQLLCRPSRGLSVGSAYPGLTAWADSISRLRLWRRGEGLNLGHRKKASCREG